MTEQQHELLNKYEEGLRKMVTDYLSEQHELEGQLLEVEELKEKWKSSAPSYMADAVPEIAKYPLVAIAWAMYEGMGAAVLWDKEWNRYENEEDFHKAITVSRKVRGVNDFDFNTLLIPVGKSDPVPTVRKREDGNLSVNIKGKEYTVNLSALECAT